MRCEHASAGKKLGWGGKKIGNAHLRWAFAEAACLFLRCSERAKRCKQKQAAQRGEGKALAILAAKRGRAVYHLLRKREAFDEARFWQGGVRLARSQVRLLDVLELMGFTPSGRWQDPLRGPCPVHRSRTPRSRSFAVHLLD